MEKLCENFKPQFLLSDDGKLQAKNTWNTAMEKYTRYLRDCTTIPEGLYYDLFASMCDADMQKKLENIKGIKTMSEKKIWEEIEKIFLSSNPIYIRRVQALETRIIKGETVSDFYHRLKIIFREAEMEKASMGTIMISILIASLPSEGREAISLFIMIVPIVAISISASVNMFFKQ